jgi:AcrR family transcriptional regulator
MGSYIAERREEEKDRRRTQIVDAAEALYAEGDWGDVTMDMVARRARLSRALIYVYFRDKRALHFALVERALAALHRRFEAASRRRTTGLEKVEAIGRAYVTFASDVPHYFDACSRFQAHQPEDAVEDANEAAAIRESRAVLEVLVAALVAGTGDGSIRGDLGNPLTSAVALWAFTHGIIQIAATKGMQLESLGVAKSRLIEQSFALLRDSLAARKP